MKTITCTLDANSVTRAENASDHIDNRVLGVSVAESHPVAAGARFVRLSGNALFYFNPNGAAAVPVADVTDGSGSAVVPAGTSRVITVDGVTAIGLIAPAATIVSLEWFN